jgi:hypothetical protein
VLPTMGHGIGPGGCEKTLALAMYRHLTAMAYHFSPQYEHPRIVDYESDKSKQHGSDGELAGTRSHGLGLNKLNDTHPGGLHCTVSIVPGQSASKVRELVLQRIKTSSFKATMHEGKGRS